MKTLLLLIALFVFVTNKTFLKSNSLLSDDSNNIYRRSILDGGIIRLWAPEFPDIIIPLKNINVNIKIQENIARVEIEQEYLNDNDKNLQTEYYFPVSEKAVFDKFEAKIGNKTIVGEIKEKKKAQEEYTENLERGNTVAYSDITKNKDIMKVKIGNLLPNQSITLKYSYIELLDVTLNKFWRLIVFSTLTPLYAPTESLPPPPITNVRPSPDTYTWQINTEIFSSTPITFIKVPSHKGADIITYSNDNKYARITLDPQYEYDPNKNYELYYSVEGANEPKLMIEQWKNNTTNDYVGYISFFPEFNKLSQDEAFLNLNRLEADSDADTNKNTKEEFIFIADRSGSMAGDRIDKLRTALVTMIRSLPKESYFNIVSFGSTYQSLYKKSKLVKDFALDAIDIVDSFDADMGGTEILAPIKEVYDTPYVEELPRIIFLLTDGDVSNSDEVIDLIRRNKLKARVNAIGIGSGASNYLIKNAAKAGNGLAEFVSDNEDLTKKILTILQNSISPYLNEFKITFPQNENILNDTYPKLNDLQFVLKNEPFQLFFFLNKDEMNNNNFAVNLSYFDSYANKTESHEVKLNNTDKQIVDGTILHKFAIKRKIDDILLQSKTLSLEDKNKTDTQVIDLSVKYQVLSELTAFILVAQYNDGVTGPAEDVLIPNIESEDYAMFPISPWSSTVNRAGSGGAMYNIASRGMSMNGGASFLVSNMPVMSGPLDIASIDSTTSPIPIPSARPIVPGNLNNTNTSIVSPSNDLLKLIPKIFWVDINGNAGKDYVMLYTFDKNFLFCDNALSLTQNNQNILRGLWIPELIDTDTISFKLYNIGDYLKIKNNTISCNGTLDSDSKFKVKQIQNYIILTSLNGEEFNFNAITEPNGSAHTYPNRFYPKNSGVFGVLES